MEWTVIMRLTRTLQLYVSNPHPECHSGNLIAYNWPMQHWLNMWHTRSPWTNKTTHIQSLTNNLRFTLQILDSNLCKLVTLPVSGMSFMSIKVCSVLVIFHAFCRLLITPYTRWYNRIFTSKSWYKTQHHVRGWTGVKWRCFDVYRQYKEELWAETLRRNKVYLPLFFAISSLL